ncbi:MAG: ZIP family metal transporter [Verrucomicrobia bacterium]|nr:ZIP family metal transporter [Verrucomicrobiota bacterium]
MDYLLLLSSIAAGALTVLLLKLEQRGYIKLLNAFTGGYLLTLTFLHLLPELYHDHGHAAEHASLLIGGLILAGFFVQIVLDIFSMGVEHGHAHDLHGHVPLGVVTGLCLHALIEAMALGDAGTHHDPASRQMLLWSIVLHNYPVSIALLGMLLHAGMSRARALGLLGLFAAMAPLGLALSAHSELARYSRELMAVVIGIFMHISTTILFESSDGHRFNYQKTVAIVIGAGLGLLSVLFH